MGFNVSGIVINKNYNGKLDELKKEFGWTFNMEGPETISFHDASSNWKDEGICDIYFSEQGTLLFLHYEMCMDPLFIKNFDTANVLTFALTEISMAFSFIYCEGDTLRRRFFVAEDRRHKSVEHGTPLPVEETETDPSEIIWKQMAIVLGKRFWDIASDEPAYRFTF